MVSNPQASISKSRVSDLHRQADRFNLLIRGRIDYRRAWQKTMPFFFAIMCIVSGCHSIAVYSSPSGARVFMNDIDTGKTTPAEIRVRDLPVGRTSITVVKEGYTALPLKQNVDVEISTGSVIFSLFPPVFIKNLFGDLWRGITYPRDRRLEEFEMQVALGDPSAATIVQKAVSATHETAEKPKTGAPKKIKRIDTMIAVFDLETVDKVDKGISRPLSESIRREIFKSGRWELIDRGNMDKILGEQKYQLSGCISGQCIVEAGQLLGVGKIVAGSVSLIGKTYYLSLSLINAETGKIEAQSEDTCKCEIDDLIDSSKRLIKKLLGENSP